MSETFSQAEARDALLPALMTLGLVVALMLLGTWWINLYNFMDGIDGIAASQALFMLLAGVLLRSLMLAETGADTAPGLLDRLQLQFLMTDPWSTGSLIIAAATAGFLVHN